MLQIKYRAQVKTHCSSHTTTQIADEIFRKYTLKTNVAKTAELFDNIIYF